MERVSEDRLKEKATSLKKEEDVVGLWNRMQRTEAGHRTFLVIEKTDGASYGLTLDMEGKVTEIPGKIIKRREQRGYPIRVEVFVPDDGSEEVILIDHEF